MAQKRMFDKTITNSDDFIEMPDSSQNLYFHLSMNADDDGFVNNWKSIVRMTGHKEDDLKILISKQYLIPFESGVLVIKHWRINNYLRNDRYTETKYQEEKSQLHLDNNMVYQLATNGIHRLDKNRLDKNSIDKIILTTTTSNNNIFEYIEENFGRTLSSIEYEKINKWLLSFDEETIKYAVQISVLNNRKSFSYINGIIRNWKTAGYKTLEEIKEADIKNAQFKDKAPEKLFNYDWINDSEGEENDN